MKDVGCIHSLIAEVIDVLPGLIVGSPFGGTAFELSHMNPQRGLPTSLLLDAIGGGIAMQLASMVTGVPGIGDARYVFSLVMAAAAARVFSSPQA